MARDPTHHDFVPAIVAAMERPPAALTRVVSMLIVLLAVAGGAWAYLSRVDIVVSARGEIVPAGRVKVVQAAADGVVREIFVGDGEVIEKGAPLIELDRTASEAREAQLRIRMGRVLLTIQRLRTELGEPVEIGTGINVPEGAMDTERRLLESNQQYFRKQRAQLVHARDEALAAREVSRRRVDKLRTRVRQLKDRLARRREQAELGLVPGQEVTELRFELENADKDLSIATEELRESGIRLRAAAERLRTVRADRRRALYRELADAEQELETVKQELVKARRRSAHQLIKAPVAGVVQQLAVHTVGAVVARTQKLMVIVPGNAGLEMDAEILNKDIGFVHRDQSARVKVDAFEFTRYGHIDGRLEWVGGDAVVDEQKGPVYPVRIALSGDSMPNPAGAGEARIVPGMQATADIVVGERRLIEYFVAPLLRYRDQSLRER